MNRTKIVEKKFNFFSDLHPMFGKNRIILHHTGGADIDATAEQIHQWHLAAGYAGIGYHFVIRKNGSVERGRPINTVGAHAYGANANSIGIHLSGDFTYASPTPEQLQSCATLIADLCETYKIPLDRQHIIGHRDTIPTECPGNFLYNQIDVIIRNARFCTCRPDSLDSPNIVWYPRAGLLTEHFSETEFACECCGKCEMNPRILELLEQLRFNIGGYPLYIKKGYSCKTQGGAEDFHCKGVAADIEFPEQLSRGQFKWYIEHLPFDGIGYYKDYVHLDARSGGSNHKFIWEEN